jgi:hypothetical protein
MLTVVFLGIGFVMKVESLEQQIAKQEERLKQLKAQKQAVLAREKRKQRINNEKKILDVKFYLVLTCLKKWKMKLTKKKYSVNLTSI